MATLALSVAGQFVGGAVGGPIGATIGQAIDRQIFGQRLLGAGGEVVEQGDGDMMTSAPSHTYSRQLLMSAPVANPARQRERRETLRALEAESAGA
mgnify:CR=1 FL=1